MPRIRLGREIAEDVQQVAAVPQRVDQRGVAGACVLRGVAVLDEVDEALRLGVVLTGLAVDGIDLRDRVWLDLDVADTASRAA